MDFNTLPIPSRPGLLRVGVVGYCSPSRFDLVLAETLIKKGFDLVRAGYPNQKMLVVSGLTNNGVLKIAYEEAKNRGWKTAGVACEQAYDFKSDWFPVDLPPIIVGKNWGDESPVFLASIDVLVKVGGGAQSAREAQQMLNMGKPVYSYELPKLE
ncbi:MAG: hypothetical protein KGH63_01140 [Candidatus Micrarchaeota archaeon]|nr:hypothetical protein [Candidatus Micrarchaeota archaeon]